MVSLAFGVERPVALARLTGVDFQSMGRWGWRVVLAAIPLAVIFSGCTQTHTIAECVLGAHHPPGREDVCVPDAIPPATQIGLLSTAQTTAQDDLGTAEHVTVVEGHFGEAVRYTGVRSLSSDLSSIRQNATVWVVEIRGHFGCEPCPSQYSTPAFHPGTTIIAFVDFNTLVSHDFATLNKSVDLSHLGPVHVLK